MRGAIYQRLQRCHIRLISSYNTDNSGVLLRNRSESKRYECLNKLSTDPLTEPSQRPDLRVARSCALPQPFCLFSPLRSSTIMIVGTTVRAVYCTRLPEAQQSPAINSVWKLFNTFLFWGGRPDLWRKSGNFEGLVVPRDWQWLAGSGS